MSFNAYLLMLMFADMCADMSLTWGFYQLFVNAQKCRLCVLTALDQGNNLQHKFIERLVYLPFQRNKRTCSY